MIQKSAYMGRIPSAARRELIASLRRLMRGKRGNIQVFTIDDKEARHRVVIGDPVHPGTGEGLEKYLA